MDTIEIGPARPGDAQEMLDLQHAAYAIEGARHLRVSTAPQTYRVRLVHLHEVGTAARGAW